MGYVAGYPQQPVALFISGEEYLVTKYYGTVIKNKEYYLDLEIEEVESEIAEGIILQPRLITIDGNAFWVWQTSIEIQKGIEKEHFALEPFEWVVSRLKLTEKDLDKTSQYSSVWGIMRRTFPITSRVILSDNPEKPIWLLLTTIEGEKVNWDNPSLAPIIELKSQLDRKDARISELEAEVEELREKNRKLIRITKEEKEEFKEIFGEEKIVFPAPSEYTGKRIKEGRLV